MLSPALKRLRSEDEPGRPGPRGEPAAPAATPATPATPGDAPALPGRRALAGIAVASMAFFLLQILTYGHGRDQAIYAMVARVTLEGGMPYRDAFDFKPPGIFLLFTLARALFGPAQWGIRVLEVAGLVGMAAAMVRLSERWWGDRLIGLLAAALAIMVHAQLDFWHTAQPESFGGMLTMVALLAATPPTPGASPRAPRLLLVGVLFGLAGLLKPPLAGGGAVVAVMLAARTIGAARPTSQRAASALRIVALIGLGGALPIAACLLWFAARGALADLHRVLFVFTPYYTKLGWEGRTVLGLSWYGFAEWLTRYSGPVALGLGCLVALHPSPRERWTVALLAGVVAIYLAGVVMQAKFFPYHYAATWPAASMLAALGLCKAWERCARRGRRALALLAAAFTLVAFARSATKDVADDYLVRCARRIAILAGGARDQAGLDQLASVADVNAGANREVAAFLRAEVPPGQPVFVWGFEPVIYDLADRPLSTPYLYNVPQRVAWSRDEARAELMRDLAARPPAAIVVERHDVFPMVTGEPIDSRDVLPAFPALRDLLADRYEIATTIEDFEVYLARPPRGAP